MPLTRLDATGLTCPQPAVKVTVMATKMKPGDVLEVVSDCPSFERDMEDWCNTTQKSLLWVGTEGSAKRCRIHF